MTNTDFPNDPRPLAAHSHPRDKPDSELYVEAISRIRRGRCRISAANFVDLSIVIERQSGANVLQQCDALFRRVAIVIEPVAVG